MVLKAIGTDPECLDESQLDSIARRFESAARTFDEKFRLYQYALKQNAPAIPHRTDPNPVVQRAIDNRLDYLAHKARDLYTIDTYLVVAYEGCQRAMPLGSGWAEFVQEPLAGLSQLLSAETRIWTMDREIERAKEHLTNKVNSFVVFETDAVAQLTRMGSHEAGGGGWQEWAVPIEALVRIERQAGEPDACLRLDGELHMDPLTRDIEFRWSSPTARSLS